MVVLEEEDHDWPLDAASEYFDKYPIKNVVLQEYNHVNPQDDEEGKSFLNSRKMGEYRKSIETCNKVLDANLVHVKDLYRRGMAYMLGGRACYCCEGDYGPQEYDCNKARSPKTISGITIFDTKEKKTYDSVPDLEIFVDPI
ncbi:hypothetical protein J5N97_028687 [Dioscorea zingiberensis]|uniref:Uncharacterized protein n=1 Tax=Dioscorea zingiberensis TaxID=325984 RepID=A0A9D5BZL7_9LILI|nr:hypothetical protein J5N97_028687 [Dioscorea zingiberensis]